MSWRRVGSIAVLLAVAAVGTAAVVDAFRPDSGDRSDTRATTTTTLDPVAAALEVDGIGGVLYYSDPEDDCRVHAVRLPGLEQVPPPQVRACRFELPPDPGTGALPDGATWSPDGELSAVAEGSRVSIWTRGGPVGRIDGRAPAWKPDGSLTVIRNGEVWGERKLLSATELARAARTLQIVPADPRQLRTATAFEVAWLTDSRAAVLVRVRLRGRLRGIGPITALALYEGRRLVRAVPYSGARALRLSPRRTFLAVMQDDERVAIVDSTGRTRLDALTMPAPSGLAVAWSPDERWTAVASRWSVHLLPTADIVAGRAPRSIRLPLAVRDLAWR
jgi:hypothetical protein